MYNGRSRVLEVARLSGGSESSGARMQTLWEGVQGCVCYVTDVSDIS